MKAEISLSELRTYMNPREMVSGSLINRPSV